MHLRKHDLLQMDAEWLKKLPAARLLEVSIRLLDDVKELQDRLNQNPANSSRPPTSQVPWEKPGTGEEEDEGMPAKRPPAKVPEAATEAMDTADSTEETVPQDGPPRLPPKASERKPGKQPGSQGHGRTQQLTVTDTCEHRPACCAACGLTLATAIYAARIDPPPEGLRIRYAAAIERLRQLCEAHQADDHKVLGSVAREFLYDWKVILRPVDEPHLSLTNNAVEQALRHWVIARYLSHGTRSEEGSRAFALLASVIETCRRREACAWRYLGTVIEAARKSLELPALPAIPVAA